METIYPNRLDLGLGRAPGTDQLTASAIRRSKHDSVHDFPNDVQEILKYFGPLEKQGFVKAYPGVDSNIPLYILGSSTDSARLAAKLGLPYSFAAHFAPRHMAEAIKIYREQFEPSEYLDQPYMMVCLNVIAAETDEEAIREKTTLEQFFLNVVRGTQNPLNPPIDNIEDFYKASEKQIVDSMTSASLIGSKETVKRQLTSFQEQFDVDEIMAITYIYDREKQRRSFEILKEVVDGK
ncbi:luciferase family oxidoreductase group 1 [Alkalibacillus filiformis]|uniref:Luciferase family oxidoreductase group 1 n=1 Tax=Alkalibacillus filiformis TaxID=200990 RepID=A0ABU0DQP3_9BACI|nr:luciferase family oxidoreductase group 1 [Alkalibacillus filiformis]